MANKNLNSDELRRANELLRDGNGRDGARSKHHSNGRAGELRDLGRQVCYVSAMLLIHQRQLYVGGLHHAEYD